MVRGKVSLQKIENPSNRRVTFSKRKTGMLKKADELSVLCDADVGLFIFSPTGKLYQFSRPTMERIIGKYQKGCASMGCGKYQKGCASTGYEIQLPEYVEILRLELEELRKELIHSETLCKHIAGKDLHLLNFKQLEQLEKKISASVRKIRLRKDKISLENIEFLKMKEKILRLENVRLDKEIGASHKVSHRNMDMMEGANNNNNDDDVETEAAAPQDCLKLALNSRNSHDQDN